MRRIVEPEIIDDPSTSTKKLEHVLHCVRITNRRLGGTDVMLDRLKEWSPRWPRDRAITMLDIGTGSGDIPLAAVRWAREAGLALRVTGIDANDRVLKVARELCKDEPSMDFVNCDAMTLLDERASPWANASFDYIHASMFLHHLDDATAARMLSAMARLAKVGFIWNDLIRSRRGYLVSWVVTIGQAIRHDCLASLRAGFTRTEALALASRLGLTYAQYHERFSCQRFTLSGEKPRAWQEPASRSPSAVPAVAL